MVAAVAGMLSQQSANYRGAIFALTHDVSYSYSVRSLSPRSLDTAIIDSRIASVPQLIVRKLESSVVRRLRIRAAAEGVSVEEAHRRVLRQALLGEPSAVRKTFIEYLQSMPDLEAPITRSRDLPRQVAL